MAGKDETKIRVRLDLGEAQASLRGMVQQAQSAGARVGDSVSGAMNRGLGLVGLDHPIKRAAGELTAPTSTGVSAVFSELVGGYAQSLEYWALGGLAEKARADAAARAEVHRIWDYQTGLKGSEIPEAKAWFQQARAQHGIIEAGRRIIETSSTYRTVTIEKLAEKFFTKLGELMGGTLADAIADRIGTRLMGWVLHKVF